MVEMNMEKKGQVTIFIILGIVIVAAVLVFFLWAQPTYFSEGSGGLGFEGCVGDAIEQGIEQLESTSGFINPEFAFSHQGEALAYLCYTNEFYKTCKFCRRSVN